MKEFNFVFNVKDDSRTVIRQAMTFACYVKMKNKYEDDGVNQKPLVSKVILENSKHRFVEIWTTVKNEYLKDIDNGDRIDFSMKEDPDDTIIDYTVTDLGNFSTFAYCLYEFMAKVRKLLSAKPEKDCDKHLVEVIIKTNER